LQSKEEKAFPIECQNPTNTERVTSRARGCEMSQSNKVDEIAESIIVRMEKSLDQIHAGLDLIKQNSLRGSCKRIAVSENAIQFYRNCEIHKLTEDEYLECSLLELAESKGLPRELVTFERYEERKIARAIWRAAQSKSVSHCTSSSS